MPELEKKLELGSLNMSTVAEVLKDFKACSLEEKREVFAAIENKTPAETKKIIAERSPVAAKKKITIEVDEETWRCWKS